MARQSSTPVQFTKTTRGDRRVGMTSGRAGVVLPIDYIPLLRGDSASGSFMASLDLAEMPKPLQNAVTANFQAWFVPKAAHTQFSGYDEFMMSYQGGTIRAQGQADRVAPPFFQGYATLPEQTEYRDSDFLRTMGIHMRAMGVGNGHNLDLLDAYNLVQNYRLAAHSTKLTRRPYAKEDLTGALKFQRAFWPSGKFRHMVPDYERALILGSLDLDVLAGQIPISGLGISAPTAEGDRTNLFWTDPPHTDTRTGRSGSETAFETLGGVPQVFAEMTGQQVGITLADIDKARTTQSFGQLRTAYAGNNSSGFDVDDEITAELMQGFAVPEDMFKRPWLLDSRRVTFGMVERHATDGASLDESVSVGRAAANLSLNVPVQDTGGIIIITCEVLPEQVHERQGDWFMHCNEPADLPNALRDVQRPEPVDIVQNWRIDELHSSYDGIYGYEPMNAVWDRDFTTLGGSFYQATPGNPWTEQRSAIWLAEPVDQTFTADHWLAPDDFPHNVFSDTLADAFEIAFRHSVVIRGITQIGDVLAENNDDYQAVQDAQ